MRVATKHPKTKKAIAGWRKENSNFVYYFLPKVAKKFGTKKIIFEGFNSIPTGLSLYDSGGGFNLWLANKIGGSHFLDFIKTKYNKKFNLTVFNIGGGSAYFRLGKKTIALSISFKDFTELLKDLGTEIKEKKAIVIQKRLAKFFPKEKEFKDAESVEESTNSKLNNINLNNLDKKDHEAVGNFIKHYISINEDNDEVLKNIQANLVIQGRKKTLEQVIKKFERHLKNKNYDEKKWQKFLHEDVFFFLSNYVESIREADVNFGKIEEGAKKPDFVWIDTYGFLDVFEIKTPFTDVLARKIDTSHKNYYFSTHASKAISQIEKYILFLEGNVKGFENYLSKKTRVPFSVLKPKAFLIIGNSKEFENNPEKKKDFRVLRRLFKNIEFITFNELLDNLKNLVKKFEKISQ